MRVFSALLLCLLGCATSSTESTVRLDASGADRDELDGASRDARADDATNVGDAPATSDAIVNVNDAAVDCAITRTPLSPTTSSSWRYGGGADYPDRIAPTHPCAVVVTTATELETALMGAGPGDLVFVADGATIDLTGKTLCIPGGVTLAGGRGHGSEPGGRILVRTTESRAALRACGSDVRITGLRIEGWEPTQCPPEWPDRCTGEDRTGGVNCRDCMPRSRGIQASDVDRLEVDNCELTGWSYGAIEFRNARDNHIHHNHIHHNQRQGLGYGVVLSNVTDPADALIEWNRFDYNRHSVAGSGAVGHSYEARNNLVLSHANGHVFDMHGIDEALDNGSTVAGTRIDIHDNTVLPTNVYDLVVRGRPTEGSYFYRNCVSRANASQAARQSRYTGNFSTDRSPTGSAPNQYGQSGGQCETTRFCYHAGAQAPLRYLTASGYSIASLSLADFNGNAKSDVFRSTGGEWFVIYDGTGSWQRVNASSVASDELAFGDFDGDGKDDVFHATGSAWRISSSATSSWKTLRNGTGTTASLRFGDFNGDKRTDVLQTDGTTWWYYSGGAGNAQKLNASGYAASALAVADFDGNGIDDVFRAGSDGWFVSTDGRSGWTRLNTSSYGLASLRFADFDGDGKDDVFRTGGERWYVSWGGSTSWQVLAVSGHGLPDLDFGDFDGDGRSDVFRTGCY